MNVRTYDYYPTGDEKNYALTVHRAGSEVRTIGFFPQAQYNRNMIERLVSLLNAEADQLAKHILYQLQAAVENAIEGIEETEVGS